MRSYLSKRACSIAPYTAGEQPKDRRYIKLNTNENPYPPSPAVQKAIETVSVSDLRLYPRPNADGLREAIAAYEGVSPENVFCGNGSDEVLALCFPAFFDRDTAACFAEITYSFYEVFARFFDVPFVTVPLEHEFDMPLAKMCETDCKGYFIANPNAPTGVGVSRDTMEAFLASVGDRVVVVDEAYIDFYGQSCVPLTQKYPNVLVVKTFSKSYSLAGIRCGYAVGDRALIDGLFRMKDCFNSYPVDSLAQAVCTAAIGDIAYHDETVAKIVAERERLRESLLSLGMTVPPSKSNFLFAGRCKVSGKELYLKLREAGVLVRFWDKPFLRDFCRITVGTPEQNDTLLRELNKILSE